MTESPERWVALAGFENLYEVSSDGRFRSVKTGKIKATTPMSVGYHTVKLTRDLVAKTFRAHSLVLASFIGQRPKGAQTRHLNGNRADNRISNLAWGTPKENHQDKLAHGTYRSHYMGKHYKDHPNGKLTKSEVAILAALSLAFKQKDLAAMAGVSQSGLSRAISLYRSKPKERPWETW